MSLLPPQRNILPTQDPVVYEVGLVVDEEPFTHPDGRAGKKLKIAVIGKLEDVDLKSAAIAGLGALGKKFNTSCAPERIVVRAFSGHPTPGAMARPLANIPEADLFASLQKLNTMALELLSSKLAAQCDWELGVVQGAAVGIQGQVIAPAERVRQASLAQTVGGVREAIKMLPPARDADPGPILGSVTPASLAGAFPDDILDAPISPVFPKSRKG